MKTGYLKHVPANAITLLVSIARKKSNLTEHNYIMHNKPENITAQK